MAYTAVPVYLDPPNWQQQDQQIATASAENHPLTSGTTTTSSCSSIRPPLLLERTRGASTQPPEPALKCPRCESINTKFCYYNNYSKSQPRHFCKTCRRYWTRGGALRNVPVGGGCRRNKRNKNNNRSSPVGDRAGGSAAAAASGSAITISSAASGSGSAIDMLGLDHQHQIPLPQSHLPFMATLQHLTEFTPSDIALPFAGIHPLRSERLGGSGGDMDFPVGQNSGSIGQWRLQQPNEHFPVTFGRADTMAGLEPVQAPGLFPFDSEGVEQQYNQLRAKPPASRLAQLKLEDNQGQNLPRQFLGLQATNDQYWTGNAWTDLSGFTPSTSSFL